MAKHYNPMAVDEDIYIPIRPLRRACEGRLARWMGITKRAQDAEGRYIMDKLAAVIRIPKELLGYLKGR